jgi:hypothetical protein
MLVNFFRLLYDGLLSLLHEIHPQTLSLQTFEKENQLIPVYARNTDTANSRFQNWRS